MTFLAHIADLVLNQPLLITPDKAEVIASVLGGRIGIGGPELSRFEGTPFVMDEQGRVKERPYRVTESGVAIITITGSLVNRGAWIGASSGLTSYEGIQHQLKVARDGSEVRSIVLDISSPGGEAVGCFETAALVREIGTTKPVTALVNGMACSGAYAIASGARDIVTIGSGVSGSIGVITLHVDASRQLENEGLKPTLIIAGAHKADGHPFGPLPESVREDFQARINGIYDAFLACVAAGRGDRLTVAKARATEARMLIGQAAVDAGLADRVGTFESVLADLSRGGSRTPSQKGRSMSETQGAPAAVAPAGTFTQAQLDAAVTEARTAAEAGLQPKIDAAVTEALNKDRVRVAGLDAMLTQLGNHPKAVEIVNAAKADGSSVDAAKVKLFDAGVLQQAGVLAAMRQDEKTAVGATPAAPGGPAPQAQGEEAWKAEFEGSDKLKAEYGSASAYVAFKKAEQRGRIRLNHGAKAA